MSNPNPFDRIDTYLDDLARRLGPLSPEAREAELAEARAHLESLAAKFAAQGESAPEAAAIQQYGSSAAVAGKICAAWRRGQQATVGQTVFFAFGLTWVCEMLYMNVASVFSWLGNGVSFASIGFLLPVIVFGVTFFGIAGILFGRRFSDPMAFHSALKGFLLQRMFGYLGMFLPTILLRNWSVWSVLFANPVWLGTLSTDVLLLPLAAGIGIWWGQRTTGRIVWLPSEKEDVAFRFLCIGLPLAGIISTALRISFKHPNPKLYLCLILAAYVLAAVLANRSVRQNGALKIGLVLGILQIFSLLPLVVYTQFPQHHMGIPLGGFHTKGEWLAYEAEKSLLRVIVPTLAAAIAYQMNRRRPTVLVG